MASNKKMRDSNIELCRIICMLMIIGHHCVSHGGGIYMDMCTNWWIAYAIYPGGKICFDTFIAISAWFLVDQSFKSERFIKMWLEVLFYSIVTVIVAAVLGSQFSGLELFSAFLPITGGVQGYAQTYLAFYLLVPFLSKIAKGMTKKQNIFINIVFTLFVVVFRMMSSFVWSEQSVYCRVILFIYFYFLMLYVKRYTVWFLENRFMMLLIFIFAWLDVFGYYCGSALYPELSCWKYLNFLVCDEGGILFIMGGFSMFFLFKSIQIKSCKWINTLSSVTLAVLLLHDGHFSRKWTWIIAHTSEWYYSKFYFINVIICSGVIYIVCAGIELIRKRFLEQSLFNTAKMKYICIKCDSYLANESGMEGKDVY